MRTVRTVGFVFVTAVAMGIATTGCRSKKTTKKITIDGSSTVAPISEKMAEEFKKKHPNVNISVGTSGTGGGMKKFTVGETDISDASRPIKDSEKKKAKENKIAYIELKVAMDGLTVIIHKENDWAKKLTVEQLNKIWRPNNPVKRWNELDPKWPDKKIDLFGPGVNSGTFDYFTEEICGKTGASRTDYTSSEDDNVILKGILKNKYALGYLGLAYYQSNKSKLTAVAIKGKTGDYQLPTTENVESGAYAPLSRPLLIYVSKNSLRRPEVKDFVKFYLDYSEYVQTVGYVQLNEIEQLNQRETLQAALK